jgi:hypothetical protein
MPYVIAGIDVHKKMLAIAVADVEIEGDVHFERLKVGTNPVQLRALAEWLVEREVEEVVMESTAQYWRPVWEALERYWRPKRRARPDATPVSGTLHLAQAQSNRGAGGRKRDFPDAERLVKRLVAQELTLSFVPDAEQRLWRTVMRRKYQITRSRVQLQPARGAPRGSPHQDLECRVGLVGHQRASHAAGGRRRCNGSGGAGGTGRSAIAGHARAIARRLRCVRGSASGVSAADKADAR